MTITDKAIAAMDETKTRLRIGLLMDVNEATVRTWIKNKNVLLTTAGVLQIIREETGLKDKEILEA